MAPMTPADAANWIRTLLADRGLRTRNAMGVDFYEPAEVVHQWLAEAEVALQAVLGPSHTLTQRWASSVEQEGSATRASNVNRARGILKTAQSLLDQGRLTSLLDGVRVETVGELLEQAELLNEKGYVVAATVVCGGALETHLRHLCDRAGCLPANPKHYSISSFEGALAQERKAGREVITATDGKSIASWGGLRNEAAHDPGKFEPPPPAPSRKADVRLMIQGVAQFVSRCP